LTLQRTLGFALLAIRSHRISVAGLALMGLMTVFASNLIEVIGFLYDELQNMRAIKNARTASNIYNKPILNYGCGITDLGDVNADICERDVPRFKLIPPSPAPTPFRNGSFAAAICSNVMEHVPDPGALKEELNRVASVTFFVNPNPLFTFSWLYPDHLWIFIRGKPYRIRGEAQNFKAWTF
jgi:SAM-dependent methyltransferase